MVSGLQMSPFIKKDKVKRPSLVAGLFECLVSDESIPRKTQKVFKRWKDHGRRVVLIADDIFT